MTVTTGPARWRALAPSARFIAGLALAAVVASLTRADAPALTDLLQALELRGYPRSTQAPSLSGRTVDVRPLSTSDFRGQVILVNFWASWCVECRAEMSALEQLHREFAARGLVIIGVNAREEREIARRFGASQGLSFPLVLASTGSIAAAYGVIGLPTTFIICLDGRAVALAVGPRDWAGGPAKALIQALLVESTVPAP